MPLSLMSACVGVNCVVRRLFEGLKPGRDMDSYFRWRVREEQ